VKTFLYGVAAALAVAAAWVGAAGALPISGVAAEGQAGALFRDDDGPFSLLGVVSYRWGGRFAVGAGAGYERFPREIDYVYPKYHVPAFGRAGVRFLRRPWFPSLTVDGGAAFTTTGFFDRGAGDYRYASAVNPLMNVGARVEVSLGSRIFLAAEPALRLEWMEGWDYELFVFGAAYVGLGVVLGGG
jgi:hypothetical protein